MSNNYIEIKKFDIAALSNNQVTDLVGAIEEVKTIEKQAKAKLIASGLTNCDGEYYKVKITPAHEGQIKANITIDFDKIIDFAYKNGKKIPMTIDYEALAQCDWVQELATKPEYLKTTMVKGKDYTGSIRVVKKGNN